MAEILDKFEVVAARLWTNLEELQPQSIVKVSQISRVVATKSKSRQNFNKVTAVVTEKWLILYGVAAAEQKNRHGFTVLQLRHDRKIGMVLCRYSCEMET